MKVTLSAQTQVFPTTNTPATGTAKLLFRAAPTNSGLVYLAFASTAARTLGTTGINAAAADAAKGLPLQSGETLVLDSNTPSVWAQADTTTDALYVETVPA